MFFTRLVIFKVVFKKFVIFKSKAFLKKKKKNYNCIIFYFEINKFTKLHSN